MVEPLFVVNVECPHCNQTFQTSRVRPSFKRSVQTDTDFCKHYREINPDFYVVRVCPGCGFASTENSKQQLAPVHRVSFQEKLGSRWVCKDYGGERTWEEALYTYKLALLCAQASVEKGRVVAGLLHHIAWLYRYRNDTEQERRFLQYALDEYVRAFETEAAEMDNARLMYLMGELNRRLKHYHQAVKWFSRVVNDKRINDAGMIRACREQWAVTREDMIADRVQPEEPVEE